MIAFDVVGGEAEAFKFLDSLKLIKLAVSLGGTESLAEHPQTMTHADVPQEDKRVMHISEKLVRVSVGVEHYTDLITDIEQALAQI
ncbi:MAG: PLP-dependent transferase, partial [Crocinitomicaceae bacterium]|nr:PLP-dependent transferase [Crocinitomicaceae bacterium]